MEKHKKLLQEKFQHAKEDLLYNTGNDVMWSLFRTKSEGVTIYYHDTDEFYILSSNEAKYYSLSEIADNWDPISQEIMK